ncbi:unnamed protein product [Musa banksii]
MRLIKAVNQKSPLSSIYQCIQIAAWVPSMDFLLEDNSHFFRFLLHYMPECEPEILMTFVICRFMDLAFGEISIYFINWTLVSLEILLILFEHYYYYFLTISG